MDGCIILQQTRSSPAMPDRTPVGTVLARAASTLRAAGRPSWRADAELLAAYVLGLRRGQLITADGFDNGQLEQYQDLIARRVAGAPVQHLTGTAGFRYLELSVGSGVFVPRPETELLVDWGLAVLAGRRAPLVVDLCAGSGALGLALAQERSDATVYLVEQDPVALRYLTRNATARQNAGDTRCAVVAADATASDLLPDLAGRVDLVLSNPPYVPSGTVLPEDVAGVDPDRALFGGPDGLAVIRPLLSSVARLLRTEGGLALEHDDTHGTAVPDLLRADGRFTDVDAHRDLAGRPRFGSARRC